MKTKKQVRTGIINLPTLGWDQRSSHNSYGNFEGCPLLKNRIVHEVWVGVIFGDP